MKKIFISALSLAVIVSLASCGNNASSGTTDTEKIAKDSNDQKFDSTNKEDDTKFAVEAASGGMMEVQMGQLAQQKGSNMKVKEFGKMMEDDHSKANDELKQLAATKNITLPTAMGDDFQKKYNDLAAKKGADFDKAYTDLMVDDHKEDIDKFQKEGDKGNDAQLKAWAAGKVPTLQHHLEMAQAAQDAVKGKKSAASDSSKMKM